MLGATLKLGFDASAVKSGLAGIKGTMGNFSKGIAGALGKAGIVGAGVGAIFYGMHKAILGPLMEDAGVLTDLANQTGLSIDRLLTLKEALRLAGAEGTDTGRMLSTLRKNIYESSQGIGGATESLNKLGIGAQDLKDLSLDKQFEAIGQAIHTLGNSPALESITSNLFGGRMGLKMVAFFKDYEASMKQAAANVGNYGLSANEFFPEIDRFVDQLGAMKLGIQELRLAFVKGFIGISGFDSAVEISDKLRATIGVLAPKIQAFGETLRSGFEGVLDPASWQGIGTSLHNWAKDIGKSIGDGIKESIKDVINPFQGLFGGSKPTGGRPAESIGPKIDKTNNFLERIMRSPTGAAFS